MTTLNVSTLTDEQLAEITAEARRRKMEKTRSQKYAKFEPTYTDYRKAVTAVKQANDLKKSLFNDLKKLGWGQKDTTTTYKRSKKK